MLYPSLDPNERFRDRRESTRRRKRRRRAVVAGILLLAVLALAGGMTLAGKGGKAGTGAGTQAASHAPATLQVAARPRPLPVEIRGVHVTAALASIPGKLAEYEALTKYGLNTIELDVKDEGGEIGFNPSGVALARKTGAVRDYYDPRKVAREMHRKGIYLIGRVVVFQDPYLARARPDMAIRRPDGSIWATSAGLEWVNPYDRRVWDYAVSVAAAAARAGFDEIMLDYVRFPSDGDVGARRLPRPDERPQGPSDRELRRVCAAAPCAARRPRLDGALRALGDARPRHRPGAALDLAARRTASARWPIRCSTAAASSASRHPSAEPGETVFRTLADFQPPAEGVARRSSFPWVQDWSYGLEQVRAADRRRAAPGRQGLPALERRGPLHAGRAGAAVVVERRRRATSRAGTSSRPAPRS